MDECRKQFEELISKPPYEQDIRRFGFDHEKYAWPGNYRSYPVQLAWCAWEELWNRRPEPKQEPGYFREWLRREMPAGTVIYDPDWWIPRIEKQFAAPQPSRDEVIEECAKVCDGYAEYSCNPSNFAENCAESIRALKGKS